ncbi:MAG: site-specific integrase [archaeon]|nr:MAG: site-specific integrase [archaeon]
MYKKLPYFPSKQEVDKIFKILRSRWDKNRSWKYNVWQKARDKLILYCNFYMGMRILEISGVNISNIDFKTKTIKITTEFAKFGKERTLPLPPIIWLHFLAYIKKYNSKFPEGYLFYVSSGRRLSTRAIRAMFKKLLKKAGLYEYYQVPTDGNYKKFRTKLHFHSGRHYFASMIYEKTQDPFAVSLWLGHKNPESSWVYVHANMHVKKHIMNKVFKCMNLRT